MYLVEFELISFAAKLIVFTRTAKWHERGKNNIQLTTFVVTV